MRAVAIPRWFLAGMTLLLPTAGAQPTSTVTGSATYRERLALPPDAVFEATLEEVSRADAPAAVIGRVRLEKPGQPPFQFSISYHPGRIVEGRSYSVRARVTVRGNLMFTTDQSYPVLTQGKGNQVAMMILRHTGGSSGDDPGSRVRALPASFRGELPCADCPGIGYQLNLFPDKSFFLRTTYTGRRDAVPFYDIGRWAILSDGSTLILNGAKESPERFAVKSSSVLRKLDQEGRAIDSKLNYELRRSPAFQPIEPRLEMRGMFRYMADAATFTECQTGQRWPVAMEGEHRALEAAYLETRRQPGEELLVNLAGQVAIRPNADSGRLGSTLVVERYIGIWPGETCGAPFATSPLQETYWRLTRIDGKPVILAEQQREPSLVFRSEKSRLTGFGGCNNLTGVYQLKGIEITFSGLAATQMACIQGMGLEAALFAALGKARTWRILGEHLELCDAVGNVLARLEARPLR